MRAPPRAASAAAAAAPRPGEPAARDAAAGTRTRARRGGARRGGVRAPPPGLARPREAGAGARARATAASQPSLWKATPRAGWCSCPGGSTARHDGDVAPTRFAGRSGRAPLRRAAQGERARMAPGPPAPAIGRRAPSTRAARRRPGAPVRAAGPRPPRRGLPSARRLARGLGGVDSGLTAARGAAHLARAHLLTRSQRRYAASIGCRRRRPRASRLEPARAAAKPPALCGLRCWNAACARCDREHHGCARGRPRQAPGRRPPRRLCRAVSRPTARQARRAAATRAGGVAASRRATRRRGADRAAGAAEALRPPPRSDERRPDASAWLRRQPAVPYQRAARAVAGAGGAGGAARAGAAGQAAPCKKRARRVALLGSHGRAGRLRHRARPRRPARAPGRSPVAPRPLALRAHCSARPRRSAPSPRHAVGALALFASRRRSWLAHAVPCCAAAAAALCGACGARRLRRVAVARRSLRGGRPCTAGHEPRRQARRAEFERFLAVAIADALRCAGAPSASGNNSLCPPERGRSRPGHAPPAFTRGSATMREPVLRRRVRVHDARRLRTGTARTFVTGLDV